VAEPCPRRLVGTVRKKLILAGRQGGGVFKLPTFGNRLAWFRSLNPSNSRHVDTRMKKRRMLCFLVGSVDVVQAESSDLCWIGKRMGVCSALTPAMSTRARGYRFHAGPTRQTSGASRAGQPQSGNGIVVQGRGFGHIVVADPEVIESALGRRRDSRRLDRLQRSPFLFTGCPCDRAPDRRGPGRRA